MIDAESAPVAAAPPFRNARRDTEVRPVVSSSRATVAPSYLNVVSPGLPGLPIFS